MSRVPARPCWRGIVMVAMLFAGRVPGASAAAAAAATGDPGQAAQVEFNDVFLQRPGQARVDVSRFARGNPATPGTYRVDLYVNQGWRGRTEVTLRQTGGPAVSVQPCFDRALLERIGVDLSKLAPEAAARIAQGGTADSGGCAALPELIADASATFDSGELRLDVSVPQAAMNRQARGYVDPQYWDNGVPAALLQYNANAYRTQTRGTSTTQGYLGLTGGFNAGAWRFRHSGNLTTATGLGSHYQAVQSTLQRSIAPLGGLLTLGDGFTDGSVFDSYGFRGVQLATNDMMLPQSQRGYAPTVRGIANSNALVQIRQNGNLLYETNVAPGPFVIDDLYPTGYGGNLSVTVTEADGSRSSFEVPYASAIRALRPGVTRYGVTLGQYRSQQVREHPALAQATVQHGFTNAVTGYGGIVAAKGYAAGLVGAALTTDLGAFALDVTGARTQLPNQPDRSGHSLRLAYSKRVAATDTQIALAAYRYSSSGFLSLNDAMRLRELDARGLSYGLFGSTQRSQLQVTVNQNLPDGWGSFYLSGSTVDYWNASNRTTQFQAGYNNHFRRVNYGISLSRQLDLATNRWDNRVMFTLNVPLGSGARAPYSTTMLQREPGGATTVQESVSGTLGEDNAFSYGLHAGSSRGGGAPSSTTAGGNVSYVSPVATMTASASSGNHSTQLGAGLSGGIVAYGEGVVLTPTMGNTLAIVEAKDAGGARVANASGLRVDPWGRAVVPNLVPFSDNEVEIDPKGLPMSVELKETAQHTAPTLGAVVRLRFETEGGGRSVLLRARLPDGGPVPFGAQVFDAQGQEVGTVAQGGRVVLRRVKDDSGEFMLKWGEAGDQQCRLRYALPAADEAADGKAALWATVEAVCAQ